MSESYPKASLILLICEFLERFSFYGMRVLLALYFINELGANERHAKSYYHTFYGMVNITPLFGAIISDSWLEKYKTILIMFTTYMVGMVLLNISSMNGLHLPKFWFSMLSFFILSLGYGSFRPCFNAFAGDQFKLPEQKHIMSKYFLLFALAINLGCLMATILTPTLKHFKCRGPQNCYPLAFLPCTVSILVFFLLFLAAKPLYKIKKRPQGNIFVLVIKCIFYALGKKYSSAEKTEHWLDHAKDKYDAKTIDDVKVTLSVLLIFVPIPIFWTLYDQESSDWLILAAKMDGDIGFFTILPEQMYAFNPMSVIFLVPFFHSVLYPLFTKTQFCDTPLKRVCYGGFLPTISYILAALLHVAVRRELPPLPQPGMFQLRGYNPQNKPVSIEVAGIEDLKSFEIPALGFYENLEIQLEGTKTIFFNNESLDVSEGNAYGVYVRKEKVYAFKDFIEKPNDGYPRVRTLLDVETDLLYVNMKGGKDILVKKANYTEKRVRPGMYIIEGIDTKLEFRTGGVYTILVDTTFKQTNVIVLLKENTISILWMLPQFLIMAAGEIMISINGLEVAYALAPASMKSFMQACWSLANAVGNVIIVLITTYVKFTHPAYTSGFFATLMFVDVFVLIFISRNYEYKVASNQETTTPAE